MRDQFSCYTAKCQNVKSDDSDGKLYATMAQNHVEKKHWLQSLWNNVNPWLQTLIIINDVHQMSTSNTEQK